MSSSSIPLLLTLILPLTSSSYLKTVCPGGLTCYHGGQCSTGDKIYSSEPYALSSDLPWTDQLNVNNEHCTNCHEGWGGVDCRRKYEVCDDSDPNSPTCFNGGKCFKTGIDAETGAFDYICDCSAATALSGGKFRYAGKFCQHIEETKCDDEMFCTNGGVCVSVAGSDGQSRHFQCSCPEGRKGTHCEYLDVEVVEKCSLECERGVCAKGFKSYEYLLGSGAFPAELAKDLISDSGEHCICPNGYTGLTCEIEVQRCGPSKYCYHGSSCIYDSVGNPMCDCNTAHKEDESKMYAGLSCEHEATSLCVPGDDQDQKDAFCTNGGKCIEDPDSRHEGCVCPEGYSGDLCEIKADVEPTCSLECENGGSCRFGVKGVKDSFDALGLAVYETKEIDGMYCSCPSGFTGIKCETNINHCHASGSEDEHFCLHGTPCTSEDTNLQGATKKYGCNCNGSDNVKDEITQMLAGRFCEYAVTEFCFEDDVRGNSHSFCTNGGKCKTRNKSGDSKHHGCCCPAGYEGDFCQFPTGTLKEGAEVTWSPMEDCNQKLSSVTHKSNAVVESIKKIEEEIEASQEVSQETKMHTKKSTKIAVLSSFLVVFVVGGLVGLIFLRRDEKENIQVYDADAVWPPPGSNLAPMSRTWSYPAGHTLSNDGHMTNWEYSEKHGDLHDVVI